ncbi:phospholipid scramblase 2-like [Achroia grisella]|uniref:phospholipid scramblase 2-like n=1 Tax=Achroia grisella TaxID=688607 RepID=UPI0027D28D90|nr:phospholipid scramblase 2-like [Achroia grisella]
MYSKLFTILLLNVLFVRSEPEEDPCVCNIEQTQVDQKAVFGFLERVHQMGVAEAKPDRPVLPAILGPLVACGNCLDRKKRNIMPVISEKFFKDSTDLRAKRHDRRETTMWMPCPNIHIEYPGLAYICPLDEFIVAENVDSLHNVIGKNHTSYTVFNKLGQKVFLAVKNKHCRRFDLKIFNYYGNEVIQVKRPFRLCLNRIVVWAPPGYYVGSVEQTTCRNFQIKNKHGEVVVKIKAKGFFHFVYDISSRDEVIGIGTKWMVLDVKNFRITFPVDIDVGDKAVILGACFLLAV